MHQDDTVHNISASSAVLQVMRFVELEARNVALSTCCSLIPVLMAVQVDNAWMSDATSHFDHCLVFVDTYEHGKKKKKKKICVVVCV